MRTFVGYFDAIDHECLVKFIEHRIADQRVVRLIQKWLNAGVLEDGEWTRSEEGTPQGGGISPLLANVYLHYVFDLWVRDWRRQAKGEVIVVRYADDFIVGFHTNGKPGGSGTNYASDSRPTDWSCTPRRPPASNSDATRRRTESGTDGASRRRSTFSASRTLREEEERAIQVLRLTMRKRLRAKLLDIKTASGSAGTTPSRRWGRWLGSIIRGHLNYYGVPLNFDALEAFHHQVQCLWKRALSRRSQKDK